MLNGVVRFNLNKGSRKRALLRQTRKEGNLVYGGQAIKHHLGAFARKTDDFDIFSKNPKESAKKTESVFDKIHGRDDFYTKKARYKDTMKVKWKGSDGKVGTKDDKTIVDYTKYRKKIPFVKSRGVKYVTLEHPIKTKKASLKEEEFEYRHEKDEEDLRRIKFWRKRL